MNEYDVSDPWWLCERDKHEPLIATVQYIRSNQADRKVEDMLHASMYGGMVASGYGIGTMRRPLSASTRLSLNVCRNMVGAVVSKIAAKNKPKPSFLTSDGDYELREKAQMLEKFVGGVFYESGVYNELTRCFRDATVFGTGVLKVYEDGEKVCVERVMPMEIVVDDVEGRYGKPANLYQRRYVDRIALRNRWAPADDTSESANAIRQALSVRQQPDTDDAEYGFQTTADQVLVTEGWHIEESGCGRHVIAVQGCTLVDEEWDGPFPFSFLRWQDPLEGFYGVGLVDELMGIQREINKLLQQIQKGHHLITGHYLVEMGAKVQTAMINNDLTSIVKFSGSKPEYQVPSIIAPEVYNHLWQLYAKAFEITGISQLSAQGQKPAGLDSGVALRTYQDIQTERFLEVGQAYEEFVVETARQVVRSAKRVGGGYKVRNVGKNAIDIIDFSDVDIDEDLYWIKVYPTSMLPSTPAGRLQWAQDMIKSQVIPPEDVLEIVDFPDTEAYAKRSLAARKVVERNVAHILKTGEYMTPEPFDDHQLALRLVNQSYHEARLDGVPEDKLELLRRYMGDTQAFMTPPPAPPSMGPPQAPPMDPMGAPMPPAGPPMPPAMPPMAA